MPQAAVIAAALTDHSAHPFSLFMSGLDLFAPAGSAYNVPIESVTIDEVGPGGVSSMTFTIEDTTGTLNGLAGAVIRMVWNAQDMPLFLGYVDTYSFSPDFGGQGRSIEVEAIGVEAQLDWFVVPAIYQDVTFGVPAFLSATARMAGVDHADYNTTPSASSQSRPVSLLTKAVGDVTVLPTSSAAFTGTTLRLYMQSVITSAIQDEPVPTTQPRIIFTIDFYGGLRMWNDYPGVIPSDYTNLVINDVYAGPIVAEHLEYEVDPGQVIRSVYIAGNDAASSGWFYDGSGLPGRQQYLADATITTAAEAQQAASKVIADAANQVRGSFDLSDFTPAATIHVGSYATITDTAVSLAAQSYRIMEIEKTFNNSGRQNWHVSFGAPAPSITRYIRQLTRSVRP